MTLNFEQIRRRQVIKGLKEHRPRAASCYLTVGKIIGPDGKEHEDYVLEPQKMVIVVSCEEVELPNDIYGYTMPRTTLHNKGILALSTGIIDPGYKGLMAGTLINFGREPYSIEPNDRFLRVTLHEIETISDPDLAKKIDDTRDETNVPAAKYMSTRKRMAMQFPETFLNIPGHAAEIATDIAEKTAEARFSKLNDLYSKAAVLVALLTFILAIVAFLGAPYVTELTTQSLSQNAAGQIMAEVDDAPARVTAGRVETLQDTVQNLERRIEELESSQ